MIEKSRAFWASRWFLGGMLAMSVSGLDARSADLDARAQFPLTDRIADGRILHVERRNRPDLEVDSVPHPVAVHIDRTISGEELDVILTVWVIMPGQGIMKRGMKTLDCQTAPASQRDPALCGKDFPVLVLDPAYWHEGARIRFADWHTPKAAPPTDEEATSQQAGSRARDEELARWADDPTIYADSNHLFRLEDGDSVAPSYPLAASADAAKPDARHP